MHAHDLDGTPAMEATPALLEFAGIDAPRSSGTAAPSATFLGGGIVDRKQAFANVRTLLEAGGHHDELLEVNRALRTLEEYEGHGKALSDVTRALLESEKTYRLVFSNELEPMALFEPSTGRFVDVNASWVSLYGYTREEALAMNITDVSAEPSEASKAIQDLTSGPAASVDVRWQRAKNGTVFPVELTAGRLLLDGREVIYAVTRDITQRENFERTLARSEASYHALIESMPDGVIVGRKGLVVYLSPSMRRMLGYPPEETGVGTRVLDLVHPDDRKQASERIYAILSSGATLPSVEERLLRRDGTTVITELIGMKTMFDGEPAVLAIVRDVSARKEVEAQLMLNDRLASLGRLAASVGHELNNPLTYVLGNVSLLEREIARSEGVPAAVVERLSSYVQIIAEGAERMRDIVRDLKTMTRSDGADNARVDVRHLLDVCTNMAEHELRPGIKVVKDYRTSVVVRGNETRLGQVFLNLLVNAAQAIPDDRGGEHEIRVMADAVGANVVVEISDTGAGVPRELIDRIFEPFFTTKLGVGTGLGLSISHRIVVSAGGTIGCEPRPDGGTTFRVTLPAAEAAAPR
jgi:PAS domain S-box-containing protein